MVNTFGERPLGTLIALIGSSGYVMLAITNGSAAQRLRPQIGDPVSVELFVG
ncbi:MAG: SAM-dependent chlorinase/fluorinase [Anaerolineales bacterium]|nr:SAM-dependent chlorinase/fluorinase [Anaerolineales bacterium]